MELREGGHGGVRDPRGVSAAREAERQQVQEAQDFGAFMEGAASTAIADIEAELGLGG